MKTFKVLVILTFLVQNSCNTIHGRKSNDYFEITNIQPIKNSTLSLYSNLYKSTIKKNGILITEFYTGLWKDTLFLIETESVLSPDCFNTIPIAVTNNENFHAYFRSDCPPGPLPTYRIKSFPFGNNKHYIIYFELIPPGLEIGQIHDTPSRTILYSFEKGIEYFSTSETTEIWPF
ncbi:MAG: hypothetical protein M3Q58_01175 [Bacteroidota bacterium]|nr:hypothetical protein [Bacteroidota bacterium]